MEIYGTVGNADNGKGASNLSAEQVIEPAKKKRKRKVIPKGSYVCVYKSSVKGNNKSRIVSA